MHYQLIEAPLIGERDSVMFLEGRHVPIVAPFERNEVVYQRSHRFFFCRLSRADRSANTRRKKTFPRNARRPPRANIFATIARPKLESRHGVCIHVHVPHVEQEYKYKRSKETLETKFCRLSSCPPFRLTVLEKMDEKKVELLYIYIDI